nr:MAG TPA: hypothetical protein [Caudoviricetes sp.]
MRRKFPKGNNRVGEIIKCSGRLHLSVEKRNQIFFAEEVS